MKFFLSSFNIGNQPDKLREILGSNLTALVITNAGDGWDSYRSQQLPRFIQDLAAIGIRAKELDLRKYFGKTKKLQEKLSDVGLIWVTGGNTFILRRAMFESGLDKILPDLLRSNKIVYGGFSAGICVLSPSLQGVHLADEPKDIPEGYNKEIIWDGLGLIDFYIVPHFQSGHDESLLADKVVEYYENRKLPYQTLVDGEALLIEDDKVAKLS
jgi:dipeptidase E